MSRVDDLLSAPRGRALCAALGHEDDAFTALGYAVDFAAYWQAPLDADDTDVPDEQLRPWAERALRGPDIDWWRAPAALDDQWHVDLLHGDERAATPRLTGAADALATWLANELDEGPQWQPADGVEVSGVWWSAPIVAHGPVSTTRAVPGRGPLGLWFVEDEMGWDRARAWPLRARREPRVFEVHGPDDWAQLARDYPLDVTDSRSPDWRRATGRVGKWVIPNWPAVAAEFDAVHVSTWGWLTTAGRPVPVNGAASLLAGWSPDQTYWLTDCLTITGDPVEYVRAAEGWRRLT